MKESKENTVPWLGDTIRAYFRTRIRVRLWDGRRLVCVRVPYGDFVRAFEQVQAEGFLRAATEYGVEAPMVPWRLLGSETPRGGFEKKRVLG